MTSRYGICISLKNLVLHVSHDSIEKAGVGRDHVIHIWYILHFQTSNWPEKLRNKFYHGVVVKYHQIRSTIPPKLLDQGKHVDHRHSVLKIDCHRPLLGRNQPIQGPLRTESVADRIDSRSEVAFPDGDPGLAVLTRVFPSTGVLHRCPEQQVRLGEAGSRRYCQSGRNRR